jgi:hypothetical protein
LALAAPIQANTKYQELCHASNDFHDPLPKALTSLTLQSFNPMKHDVPFCPRASLPNNFHEASQEQEAITQ